MERKTKVRDRDVENAGDCRPVESDLLYSVEDTPPSYLCILLGFQVTALSYTIA